MKHIHIRVNDALYTRLRIYCFSAGLNMNEVLTERINALLGDPPAKPAPKPQPAPETKNPFLDDPLEPEPPKQQEPPLQEQTFRPIPKSYSARKAKKGTR
jgi:hypothetical protein